jgi:hypothetical protein
MRVIESHAVKVNISALDNGLLVNINLLIDIHRIGKLLTWTLRKTW